MEDIIFWAIGIFFAYVLVDAWIWAFERINNNEK